MTASKIVLNAASGVGGAGLDVEDVFSIYLNSDGSSNQVITNGIDLDGEGGLVWGKSRNLAEHSFLVDSARGKGSNNNFKYLRSGSTAIEQDIANRSLSSFNSNGFTFQGADDQFNSSGNEYVYWTFRKAKKFFDVVTYTGDGTTGKSLSHNLGVAPGVVIIKKTDAVANWYVYHRDIGTGKYLQLNLTDAQVTNSSYFVSASSTDFVLGSNGSVNGNGQSHVAYLFAHNNNDGDFGPDADQDIIKCGSYTNSGSAWSVDLGFEPQWLLRKLTDGIGSWQLTDNMRGLLADNGSGTAYARLLKAESSNAENNTAGINITSTGIEGTGAGDNGTYIYMAIRRGTKVPESGTEVFNIDTYGGTSPNPPAWTSGFPVDMALWKAVNSASYSTFNAARLISGKYLQTAATNAEVSMASHVFDYQNGWNSDTGSNSNSYSWMWKRAPGFFDVVAYTGDGTTARAISHNLGVPPQLMIHKRRNATNDWYVPDFINSKLLFLNDPAAANTTAILANYYGSGNGSSGGASSLVTPNASTFTVTPNINVNGSGDTYVVYLFASLDGVSKVGSYTGNGSTQTIDCGFSAGARFVLIKKTNGSGSWLVFDTERGIVSGNDPYFELNETATQNSTTDYMDPDNSGFVLTQNGLINGSSDTYIFYAIA